MTFSFKLPDVGEGVHEGEVVKWLVKEGDSVKEDQDIVEVMTDKATVLISSPRTGKIKTIHYQDGETIKVGEVLVEIEDADASAGKQDASPSPAKAAKTEAKAAKPTTTKPTNSGTAPKAEAKAEKTEKKEEKTLFDLPAELGPSGAKRPARAKAGREAVPTSPSAAAHVSPAARAAGILAMPKVRAEATKRGIDLATVKPTGAKGNVTMDDLDKAVSRPAAEPAMGMHPTTQFELPTIDRSIALEVEPLKGLRKRIAQNMARAKTLQAHYTYVAEVRADKLVALRDETKAIAEEQGVKLGYLPFIVKAAVRALRKHPRCNAWIDEVNQELVLASPVNVGIAAATDKGLTLPVVHDADRKTILAIAREIDELGAKARDQKLSPQDLMGGTFSITSLGKYGGLLATPILAHPQVAIMGVHAIRDVPVVRDGKIVPGKVMNLSFTFDHRVVDGYEGAMFAQDVVKFLEEPGRLLLESM